MEPIVLVAIGVVVAAAVGALAFGRARSASSAGSEPTAPERTVVTSGPTILQPSRIVVVGDRRRIGSTAATQVDSAADPRRRLLRDASAVLFAGSLGLIVLVNLPAVGGASGDVLSATATPGAAFVEAQPTPDPDPSAMAPAPDASASAVVEGSGSSTGGGPSAAPLAATPAAALARDSRAHLEPCPDRADCYVYVVQRGDTLIELSRRFGIPTGTLLRLNPTIVDPALIVTGDRLTIPTPTR